MTSRDAAVVLEITDLSKQFGGEHPLRLRRATMRLGDGWAIAGLDAVAAEALSMLITGASVPDEGDVRVFGANTRDIDTDTAWLASLDRIGLVTSRAVLLDQLPVVQNLALPLTLSVDPMPPDVRTTVEALAQAVALPKGQLEKPVGELSPLDRARVHLARSVALDCQLLVLEHPTQGLSPVDAAAFGETLRALAALRGFAWMALTEDDAFVTAAGGTRARCDHASGELKMSGGWLRRWFS